MWCPHNPRWKEWNKMKSRTISAWDRVTIARKMERPKALDYINEIFTNFIELHGDRNFGDDKSIVGGIAELDGLPVTVIGEQKGKNAKENIDRNFGMPNPEGYRKTLRLMKQAEKFDRPIITFIDTPGAYPGMGAEERGQGEAIAKNLMEMALIKTPIISIVIGEGGSGGALALAAGDRVWMLENSVYSILSPEGCASILFKDSSKSKEVAEIMKLTSYELLELGVIEKVIEEPKGGAQNDFEKVALDIKTSLIEGFKELESMEIDELLSKRYERFRKF